MTTNVARQTGAGAPLDVLFIGGVFHAQSERAVLEKSIGAVQFAANALQWNLIGGLDSIVGRPVTLLNALFVGSYPRWYRDVWVKGERWSHAPDASDESIGFLNMFGIKQAWRAVALARKARRWAAERRSGVQRAIVIYSMHMPFIVAAAMAKRVDPELKVCLVVPDLPEHMNLAEKVSRPVAVLKALDRWVMDRFMNAVDCFTLLTRHMAEPLQVGTRPWIVMEGAVNPGEAPSPTPRADESEKVVLYTGTLTKAYGILQLLEAFELLSNPEYRLWICGAGEAEPEVRAAAQRDHRVRFLGQVSRLEALKLQRSATALVNPRADTDAFTRYSFPSKIMEYMLSGTPTIVRRLPGMPEEYFAHLFVIDGDAPRHMADTIARVCELPASERRHAGEQAQRFVIENKNARAQAHRIVAMLANAGS